jgi:phospholipase D1/2
VAFLGGIDLCYNRYEDSRYLIADHDGFIFPGRDYGNLNFAGEANGKPLENVLDRKTTPRMPWHDIHMMVDGDAARDVAWNFIERWNHALRNGSGAQLRKAVYLLPHSNEDKAKTSKGEQSSYSFRITRHFSVNNPFALRLSSSVQQPTASQEPSPLRRHLEVLVESGADDVASNCTCQILRSVSCWSAGCPKPEQSIYKAYLTTIKNAQHFIYIENQYFISSINRVRPKNRIANALYQRLRLAMKNEQIFRVVVVLPVFPAGDLLSATTRYVIKYVYKTISRQKNSILEKLEEEFPRSMIDQYISFYSLRSWGQLQFGAGPITEQVYVHAKLMIVDDRIVILGSANINDRSMRGSRDSEIACFVEPGENNLIPGEMGGKPFPVGTFAHSLRHRIWAEFLGVPAGNSPEALEQRKKLHDPIASYEIWRSVAISNTAIYTKTFPGLPDTVYTLADLKRAQQLVEESRNASPSQGLEQWHSKMREDLEKVQGFLVEFPLLFLKDEQMSPTIWHKEFILPRNVFL